MLPKKYLYIIITFGVKPTQVTIVVTNLRFCWSYNYLKLIQIKIVQQLKLKKAIISLHDSLFTSTIYNHGQNIWDKL